MVRREGISRLPNKNASDAVLGQLPIVHCTGKKGDVFFLNHMSAHFVMPNTSPDIRQAVYFRLSTDDFIVGDPGPMLNPLRDWVL